MDADLSHVVSVIAFMLLVMAYFIPVFIAKARNSRNTLAIFVLVFVLGWTGIGWLVALVWAFVYAPPPAKRRMRR